MRRKHSGIGVCTAHGTLQLGRVSNLQSMHDIRVCSHELRSTNRDNRAVQDGEAIDEQAQFGRQAEKRAGFVEFVHSELCIVACRTV